MSKLGKRIMSCYVYILVGFISLCLSCFFPIKQSPEVIVKLLGCEFPATFTSVL